MQPTAFGQKRLAAERVVRERRCPRQVDRGAFRAGVDGAKGDLIARAAGKAEHAARSKRIGDAAALQRLPFGAEPAERAEPIEQRGILMPPWVGAAVERVLKAIHAGLVAVVDRGRAGEGVKHQRGELEQRRAALALGGG